MSFPPYPSGFNTYENTGYKQFWGSGGFPYVKNDFTGGSIVQYPSDDEMRSQPVMDLQNISAGCAKCKYEGKGEEVIEGGGKYGGRKKKAKKSKKEEMDIEMLEGGRRRHTGGAKSGGKKKRGDKNAIKRGDVMKYKWANGVSLEQAWADLKGCN
jgi:hypothetical protein